MTKESSISNLPLSIAENPDFQTHCKAFSELIDEIENMKIPANDVLTGGQCRRLAKICLEKLGDKFNLDHFAVTVLTYANAYRRQNVSGTALNFLFVAEDVVALKNDKRLLALIQGNIAHIARSIGHAETAASYALSALELAIESGALSLGQRIVNENPSLFSGQSQSGPELTATQ